MACRQFVQEAKESEASQVELFLNSVPLLKSLSREEKLMLVDALEEQVFPAGTRVITQARLFLGLADPSPALAAACSHVPGCEGLLGPTGCLGRTQLRQVSLKRSPGPCCVIGSRTVYA